MKMILGNIFLKKWFTTNFQDIVFYLKEELIHLIVQRNKEMSSNEIGNKKIFLAFLFALKNISLGKLKRKILSGREN